MGSGAPSCRILLQATRVDRHLFKFSVSVKKMGGGRTRGASDIVKVKSSGEDPRATGGLVSNLPHPRVNKTKQHTHTIEGLPQAIACGPHFRQGIYYYSLIIIIGP